VSAPVDTPLVQFAKHLAHCEQVPVLDPGRRDTRTCQFWAHAVDDLRWGGPSPPAVAYVFADGRGNDKIAGQLTEFSAILQVDGYAATRRSHAVTAARSSSLFAWRMRDACSSRRRGRRSRMR
jgi:hypothetical protein